MQAEIESQFERSNLLQSELIATLNDLAQASQDASNPK
jgi:hypothetical protein